MSLEAFSLAEYESRGFGVDYAQECARWIRAHYEKYRVFGPHRNILILKRRGLPEPAAGSG